MDLDEQGGEVRITLGHVYRVVVEVRAQLAALLTVGERHGQHLADHEARLRVAEEHLARQEPWKQILDDHESRLRGGERWRYAIPASALVALVGAAASLAGAFLK